ncbi:MAG: 16S rRNA (uracil(1498)-N(3))-methyltransferase [Rhodospirillales bacterium]|nr:16S rRNA (uracil(1498)-N(3))-methyltransferase [Rhodospirillales bacterium]
MMKNPETIIKLPRLYVDSPLQKDSAIDLAPEQLHYLKNVMRRQVDDEVRLFNGQEGEWLARLRLLDKKRGQACPVEKIREQIATTAKTMLLFSPLKKHRQDWLIEKAVELGVTDLCPVTTQNTDIHALKTERITAQIQEAAEQSERLSLPRLHALRSLTETLSDWPTATPLLACIERTDTAPLAAALSKLDTKNVALLIGPPGGFTEKEKSKLASTQNCTPVSLGNNVLRSETAALYALAVRSALL